MSDTMKYIKQVAMACLIIFIRFYKNVSIFITCKICLLHMKGCFKHFVFKKSLKRVLKKNV